MPGIVIDRMRAEREEAEREASIRRRIEREMISQNIADDVAVKLLTERIAKEAAAELISIRAMVVKAKLPESAVLAILDAGLTGDEARVEVDRLAERHAAAKFQRLGGGGRVK